MRGKKALSSTSHREPIHGFPCQAMTRNEIQEMIGFFAEGARRAKAAGADGVETHSANGYLFTQFLSSGINDRTDEYGGPLENRARFLLEVFRAIRAKVGNDFHVQVKISAVDRNNAVLPWEKPGNVLEDSIQVCKWVENPVEWAKAAKEDVAKWQGVRGADAIHVSSGSSSCTRLILRAKCPSKTWRGLIESVVSTGELTFRNLLLFRFRLGRWLFKTLWDRIKKRHPGYALAVPIPASLRPADMQARLAAYQGVCLSDAHEIKKAVKIPVICTWRFQQASYIRKAIA